MNFQFEGSQCLLLLLRHATFEIGFSKKERSKNVNQNVCLGGFSCGTKEVLWQRYSTGTRSDL